MILKSVDLFRIGLPGVNILIPRYLRALGLILCKEHIVFNVSFVWWRVGRLSGVNVSLCGGEWVG